MTAFNCTLTNHQPQAAVTAVTPQSLVCADKAAVTHHAKSCSNEQTFEGLEITVHFHSPPPQTEGVRDKSLPSDTV